MIKVSVIVPVYNVEEYLPKCLDTLVNQTLQDIEIIVVNDGATDNSAAVIDSFVSKYPNIIKITKENGGLSDARNYGIPYASGEYIGFIDSDDYVELDMYELLYQKAVESDSDIVECDLHHVYPDGTVDTEIGNRILDKKEMLMMGRSVVWNKIYRREWLVNTGILFPKGCIYEDVEFFSKLVLHAGKYSYVDAASVYYVQRGNSLNNKQSLKTLDIIKILDNIKAYYIEQNAYEEYQAALEFLYARILLCSSFSRMCRIADRRQRKEALAKNWKALQESFPNWHSNEYLKKLRTKKGIFMRSMNGFTYKLCEGLLPVYYRLRSK